ncbi:MAG TPA: RNA polymerase sigma factor [Candidatus Limiplasma sp.]|nr:RNA polymerase sigma factor [Candidatus Limiplasma sp.]
MSELLLQKAQNGDADAFTELCAPYEGLVYRHCLQMLKNPADAQDAAQETLLRAYRSIGGYRAASSIPTWLFRIAHNVCLDVLKSSYYRRERFSLETLREGGFEPADPQPTPESRYVRQSEQARLNEAITRLPQEQQALLSLRYGDGLSYEALANALGMNPGTVKSKLSRAKEKLRGLLPKQ